LIQLEKNLNELKTERQMLKFKI